jgi:hypothetical protein
VDKQMGGVFFYSRALHGGNTGLCKQGEREVTAQRGGRASGVHTCAARHSSDIIVAAALRGGDVRVFVRTPLARVSWPGGGARQGHTASERAPAHRAYTA